MTSNLKFLVALSLALFAIAPAVAEGKKAPAPKEKTETPAPEFAVPATPPAIDKKDLGPQAASDVVFNKVTLQEAKKLYDDGKAVFVDGRAPASYRVRHIKGAYSCSLGEFDIRSAELKEKVPLDRQLVVYCSGETCGLAEKIGKRLYDMGYKSIVIFQAGWPAWAGANYPAEP